MKSWSVQAKELFEEAASVGEADAQYNLAILYANVPVDNVCWQHEIGEILKVGAASKKRGMG